MNSAHVLTAFAYYVIGLLLITVSVKVWWTHPINRAFLFGPYLTATGVKALLRLWPFTFLFGAFIFSCALEHHADWLAERGLVSMHVVHILGTIEAAISWWTAVSMLWQLAKVQWRRWCRT